MLLKCIQDVVCNDVRWHAACPCSFGAVVCLTSLASKQASCACRGKAQQAEEVLQCIYPRPQSAIWQQEECRLKAVNSGRTFGHQSCMRKFKPRDLTDLMYKCAARFTDSILHPRPVDLR